MTITNIMKAIPHSGPMLLMNEIFERSEKQIVCRKDFRGDEFFFKGIIRTSRSRQVSFCARPRCRPVPYLRPIRLTKVQCFQGARRDTIEQREVRNEWSRREISSIFV